MASKIDLPVISGYTWRGIQPGDGHLLQEFEQACASIDGATNPKTLDEWIALTKEQDINTRSVMAINAQGEIVIVGWIEVDERVESVLAFLDGRVHPDFRGRKYGTMLLDWLETQAETQMRVVANGRPCVYRIMFYDRAPDASVLFEEKGYKLLYIEQEMQRDLRQPLGYINHQNLRFEPWAENNKTDFYDTYRAAFVTRTDTLMQAEAWHHHFANSDSNDYQPELSLLARQSGNPVAYAVIHTEEASDVSGTGLAWITQTGVHAEYRRQGIGTALLTETMKQLRSIGYQWVRLSVNVDNPGARRLYEHLGFSLINSFTMYHYELDL